MGQVPNVLNRTWNLRYIQISDTPPSNGIYNAPISLQCNLFISDSPSHELTTTVCSTLDSNIVFNAVGSTLCHITNYSLTYAQCVPSNTATESFEQRYLNYLWTPDGYYIINLYDINTLYISDYSGTKKAVFEAVEPLLNLIDQESIIPVIFPNPANEYIILQSNFSRKTCNIFFYNMSGQLLMSKDNISFDEHLDVSMLSTGYYILEIHDEEKVSRQKMIKL